MSPDEHGVLLGAEVADALATGRGVVALESTVIAHGLPRPDNLALARALEQDVREAGAIPATVAVVAGRVTVGLTDSEVIAIAERDDVAKASVRDLAPVVVRGGWGATTVASTAHIAALVGIRVFATGGLGGVHRGAQDSYDESADLTTLGRVPIAVVCSGVKSILDIPATLERLETLNGPVVGYGSDSFPGFYLTDSGQPVPHRVDTPDEVAALVATRAQLGLGEAVVVAQPLPPAEAMQPDRHQKVLVEGLQLAADSNITGKDVTPFLLAHFHQATAGESLRINTRLLRHNAALAGQIAVAVAQGPR